MNLENLASKVDAAVSLLWTKVLHLNSSFLTTPKPCRNSIIFRRLLYMPKPTSFFTYNWITNPSARSDLDKALTEIDDATGINVKKIAAVTGELAESTSKKLAESAEKSAEARAKAKLEAKANPPVDKIEPAAKAD